MALTASAEAQQGTKRTVIMILVIGLHLVALWALQNGLARRLVEVLPNDNKTKIIEEKKEEPPPPPPPPPDVQAPPPPFVPPVEVAIATPMETPPTAITTTTEKPPLTVPPVMAPAANIHKAGFDPKHPIRSSEDFYPEASIRAGEEGVTVVEIYVSPEGRVTDARIKTSSGFDRLDQAAIRYVKTWRMLPQTRDGKPEGAWVSIPIRWKIVNK
jgi:protein TonB